MAKYIVEVIVSTCVEIEVEARNEDEAQTIALQEANPFTITTDNWDYDINCVYRDGDDDGYDDDDDYDDYDYEDEEEDEE